MDGTVSHFLNSILTHAFAFILIEIRIATTFGLIFFLRREWVPARLMLAVSIVMTIFVFLSMEHTELLAADTVSEKVVAVIVQGLLGIVTALIVNFFVEFFVGFGQIVSMQAGLGFVNFFVPKIGNISPMTQFFMLLATVAFLNLNGHLVVIHMLVHSMEALPQIPDAFNGELFGKILNFSGILFEGSVMLSLAVIFSVMLSNITLAVLTKFSPQLNLFSIGINISLLICFFIIYVSFDIIVENGDVLFNQLMTFLEQLHI